MPVVASDLILPAGKLPADWFPTSDLDVWIAAGEDTAPAEATTEQADAITTAYVYWRAHDAKARLVIGAADSVSLEGLGGRSTSNGRYDRLVALASQYEAEWAAGVASATPAEDDGPVSAPPLASRSTLMVPTF